MAKFLKDIVKPKSTKVTNDLGGYAPKAGDEQDFAKKHEIEKHDDRNGNGDDVFKGKTKYVLDKPEEKRHGYKKPEDAKVNESKKAEDVSCNHTPAGAKCPVHEMADCTGSKTIKEEVEQIYEVWYVQHKDGSRTHHESGTAAMKASRKSPGSKVGATHGYGGMKAADALKQKAIKEEPIDELDRQRGSILGRYISKTNPDYKSPEEIAKRKEGRALALKKQWGDKKYGLEEPKVKAVTREEVEQIDEVITKKTSAGEVISDFVHSKNPKFAGKSKKERQRMALGAYYAKQREQKEEVSEDLAVPLLGGDPPRGDSDEAVEMVKSELKALANKAMHLVMQMPQGMHVEPWCQAKIAQAKSYVSDVHDYMIYGDHEDEKDEQMDTPLTFPNMSVDVNTGQNV